MKAVFAASICSVFFQLGPHRANAAEPIILVVDASQAPTQNIVHTHEVIPVTPGPMTLYYPQWIPGEHGPVGPIENLAGIVIRAGGQTIPWRRDPTNLFAFNFDVPAGTNRLNVDFTYLGATFGRYSSNRLASPNMLVIDWNQNVLYPATGTMDTTIFDPTLILPSSQWKFATALYDPKRDGDRVVFGPTPLGRLMDSPLDACVNFRSWNLWQDSGSFPGTASLNVCADTPEELGASDKTIGYFRNLVQEIIAMYGARHWHDYHFLLTVSDVVPGEGVEHHESSDDGESGNYLIDPMLLQRGGDLLSHEFNHSWDGKYRMPDGLVRQNLNTPYDDSLLWVYEGMTQYYGDVMSYRDGIREAKNWPDHIASLWATYDNQQGRRWRTLDDDAASGPFIYGAPRGYSSERRGEDFYTEGELLWLKADSIIRELSHDTKSLDSVARVFFGGQNTGPLTVSYNRDDLIAAFNVVQPYDWTGFFHTWVDEIAIHPPDGFTADGWKLVYSAEPTASVMKNNFAYSLGFSAFGGTVVDVHMGSPAWNAGLGFNQKIVAVNGRTYSDDLLYNALKEAQRSHEPIQLLVVKDDMYRTISIPYYDGPRYPHLVRIPGTTDRLTTVVKPLRNTT